LLAFFYVLQVVVFLTAGREGQRRRKQGRSARFRHQRRRVKPRAARNGGALEHALPAFLHEFLQFLKHFLCNSWSFEDCFVKFGLFDVIFIYFLNIIICMVDVKRKEKKKKKKNNKKKEKEKKKYSKKCMCVFEYFFMDAFIMRRQKNKEGFNILIGSRCRSTNLYESCISKFR
jgi:hypothetical protein